MKRITVSLPDDLAAALEREARRCRVPISRVVRETIEERLKKASGKPKRLSFIGIGRSEYTDTASRIDEILAQEWTVDRDR